MKEATLTTSYRYVDHNRSTQVKVTTFVSQASTHLAATRIALTPDFDGTVETVVCLESLGAASAAPAARQVTGEQMQEAVAANNMQLVAIPPATPDRAAVWYHGDTQVLAADGDTKNLTLFLDGRAEQGLAMAEASAIQLPERRCAKRCRVVQKPLSPRLEPENQGAERQDVHLHQIHLSLSARAGAVMRRPIWQR